MGRSPLLSHLIPSWKRDLDASAKSPGTIQSYLYTARLLITYLDQHDMPGQIHRITANHLRGFLSARTHGCWQDGGRTRPCLCGQTRRHSAGDTHKHFRNLRLLFKWLASEGELPGESPMAAVAAPAVTSEPTAPLTADELALMLATCAGATFADRRDTAIMRILLDTGIRGGGLEGLRYHPDDPDQTDVFLTHHVVRVLLRGERTHLAPIGRKAVAAIDRYLRARAGHAHSASPWLWLPERGVTARGGDRRLTKTGILQMLKRRAREAEIPGVHTHRFRHTMAAHYLDAGGDPFDLMRIGGWSSLAMVQRYSRTVGDRSTPARLSLGDRY
jgi:site-specific recombinase XerD